MTEPVAWGMPRPDGLILDVICPEEHARCEGAYTVPLYAAPQPKAEPVADEYVGGLEYRGNSVSYIYQKLTAYRRAIDESWNAMRDAGRGPDGKTTLADAIRHALTAPQPRRQPLMEAEIARMASGLEGCAGLPVNSTKANWRKVFDFARAIEEAVWSKT